MSIALETHTLDPLLVHRDNKLVTADLRMMDSVDQPLLVYFFIPRSLYLYFKFQLSHGSIPLWIVLVSASCLTVLVFICTTLVCIRHRAKKTMVRLPRLPDPYTISGNFPSSSFQSARLLALGLSESNGPGAFLDRLQQTERDGESLWTLAPSMESVRPL